MASAEAPSPPRRVQAAALFLASLLVSFGLLEGALRVADTGSTVHQNLLKDLEFQRSTTVHPVWGWAFLPGIDARWDYTDRERDPIVVHFRTVPIPGTPAYGARDDGLSLQGQRQVVVLGDSFTFGATVEQQEIWCERLEERHPDVDMLNLATGGGVAKAAAEYHVLQPNLPAHDTVVYAMWLGNEFADNDVFSTRKEEIEQATDEHARKLWRLTWLTRTRTTALAWWTAYQVKLRITGRRSGSASYVPEPDGVWDAQFGNFMVRPANPITTRYAEPLLSAEVTRGIKETERGLQALRDLAGARKLVVVLLPFKEQVYPELMHKHRPELDLEQPNRLVLQMCVRLGLECVDVLADLRAHNGERLYWDWDPHFTALGQQRTADAVEKLVPGLVAPAR